MIEFEYDEIIALLNCLTNDMLLRMAETTIPKDWSEVRAAVNLVERGVKVLLNSILNKKKYTNIIPFLGLLNIFHKKTPINLLYLLRVRNPVQVSSATAVKDI